VVVALVLLAFAVPSAALGKGSATTATSPSAQSVGAAGAANLTNPLSSFPQPAVGTSTTTTQSLAINSSTNASGSSSFNGSDAIVIALGAIVVLLGISFFIWRDARRRAPVKAAAGGVDGRSRAGSKPRARTRKLSTAERRRRKRGRARR
jgi:hypothetical protein